MYPHIFIFVSKLQPIFQTSNPAPQLLWHWFPLLTKILCHFFTTINWFSLSTIYYWLSSPNIIVSELLITPSLPSLPPVWWTNLPTSTPGIQSRAFQSYSLHRTPRPKSLTPDIFILYLFEDTSPNVPTLFLPKCINLCSTHEKTADSPKVRAVYIEPISTLQKYQWFYIGTDWYSSNINA